MTTVPTTDPRAADVLAAVRAASAAEPKRFRHIGFSLTKASRGELVLAPLVGLYLGYAVVRLPEVFAALVVPRGPMIVMLVFIAMLGLATPPVAWRVIWQSSKALRLATAILGLVVVTIPLGIWPTGSLEFLQQRYVISFVIFLTCLVFLRDPRALRIAAMIFVLSVTAVSANVIRTYDPNAVILNEDGDPIEPDILAMRPDLRRLQVVGVGLDANDFGAILATAFPLALWLSVGSSGRRLLWTGAAGVMVMAIVPTQSRGSMLGMLAAAIVVIGAGARGWRRILTFLLVVGGAAAFTYMAVKSGAGDRFGDFSGDDYNLTNEGRIYFWKQGMVWMLKRPWGYGIDNFPLYFGILNGPERAAHSSWVQYGMELGVAGLAIFVTLCTTLVLGLRQMRRAAASARHTMMDAAAREVQAGHMLALLAGVLVTGTFLSNAYYPMMYMALGMAAATLLGSPFSTIPTPVASVTPAASARGSEGRQRRQFRPAKGTPAPE